MAQYKPIVLPSVQWLQDYVLVTLRAQNATVYQRGTDTTNTVESRASWSNGTVGLTTTPDPIPPNWVER